MPLPRHPFRAPPSDTCPPDPRPPTPAGYFHRNADLRGLRLAVWEGEGGGDQALTEALREAGAFITLPGKMAPGKMAPMIARHRPIPFTFISRRATVRFMDERIASSAPDHVEPLHIDGAVLNLRNPAALAQGLEAAGVPFVMLTPDLEQSLSPYPHGCCIPRSSRPEVLVSAVLLHIALYHAGLDGAPEISLQETILRLRRMALFLTRDQIMADDLLADAVEQALSLLPGLDSESQIGDLLVMLLKRVWYQQKTARPN